MGRRQACCLDSMNPFRTMCMNSVRATGRGPFCRPTTPTTRAQAATRPSWSPFHQVLYPIRKDVGTVMGTVISRLSTSTSGCQLRQAAVDFDKRLSTSTSPRDLRFVDCQGQVRGPAFVEEFKLRVNAWIRVVQDVTILAAADVAKSWLASLTGC